MAYWYGTCYSRPERQLVSEKRTRMNTVVNASSASAAVGRAGTTILVVVIVLVTWGHSAQATTSTAHELKQQVSRLVKRTLRFPLHKRSLQRVLLTEARVAWVLACRSKENQDHTRAQQRLEAAIKIFNASKLLEGLGQAIVRAAALNSLESKSSEPTDWQRIIDERVFRYSHDNAHQVRVSVSPDAPDSLGQMVFDSAESCSLRDILRVSARYRKAEGTPVKTELVPRLATIKSFDALTLVRNGDTVFTEGQLGWKMFGRATLRTRWPKAELKALDLSTSIPGRFDLTP